MNIENRINQLEGEIIELRIKWKNGSPAMKNMIETKGRQKRHEVDILKKVLAKKIKTARDQTSLLNK